MTDPQNEPTNTAPGGVPAVEPESSAGGLDAAHREAAARIAAGYRFTGGSVTLGTVVVDGTVDPTAAVSIPLAMFNRHGLVAGATGTGKTKTLQVIAEQLAAAGVPVLMPDVKGDLTGMAVAGTANDRITARAADTGDAWTGAGFPVEYLCIAGQGSATPIRASIDSFGPILLSKVLDLNDTQESTLGLIFHYADQNNLPLLDLKDLRAVVSHLTSAEGKADLSALGGVSKATAGVILRALSNLEADGGAEFFGEPQLEVADLLRVIDGRGVISLLDAQGLQTRPALFSTFLMWLLSELFEELPEAGDLDQPKLVFLFDEAHLLFADASKAFLTAVQQTVKLIRSKGVGVFLCTQLPTDVPGPVLSQLGARIQHALRAFTPQDQEALASTVKTYPTTDDYDLSKALTSLGTGEAIVTVLSERGAPTPVAWTRMRAPRSLMGPAPAGTVEAALAASALYAKYSTAVDRNSAYEILTARLAPPVPPTPIPVPIPIPIPSPPATSSGRAGGDWPSVPPFSDPRPGYEPEPEGGGGNLGGFLSDLAQNPAVKSFWRSLGTAAGGALGRSITGTRRRRR